MIWCFKSFPFRRNLSEATSNKLYTSSTLNPYSTSQQWKPLKKVQIFPNRLYSSTLLNSFIWRNCVFLLDLSAMRRIGLVYFLYLFLYSGLEFTLTFLTYTKFNFTRFDSLFPIPHLYPLPPTNSQLPKVCWMFQHATGKDVFCHWSCYGRRPRRLRSTN